MGECCRRRDLCEGRFYELFARIPACQGTHRFLIVFLVLVVQLGFSADDKQKSYEAARQQASDLVDIFSAGPVRIRATFHLHVVAGLLDGKYQYSQLSKDEYREEIETPAFGESVVYRRGDRYVSRSKHLEPLPIWHLRQLIYSARMIPGKAPVSKLTTPIQNGKKLKCYASETGPFGPTEFFGYQACFDVETGVLASRESSLNGDLYRYEYSKFLRQDSKLFPATMRGFHNGKLSAEVTVDSITYGPMDAELLSPPAKASKQDACKTFRGAEAEYSKEYFQIRSEYRSGSVVIAGSLDDHGKVQETEIQQPADPKMDGAALRALKEIQFRPAKCDGNAIPSLFRLQIWFSPALHPDSFESFR